VRIAVDCEHRALSHAALLIRDCARDRCCRPFPYIASMRCSKATIYSSRSSDSSEGTTCASARERVTSPLSLKDVAFVGHDAVLCRLLAGAGCPSLRTDLVRELEMLEVSAVIASASSIRARPTVGNLISQRIAAGNSPSRYRRYDMRPSALAASGFSRRASSNLGKSSLCIQPS
jgi:hypothetical protein